MVRRVNSATKTVTSGSTRIFAVLISLAYRVRDLRQRKTRNVQRARQRQQYVALQIHPESAGKLRSFEDHDVQQIAVGNLRRRAGLRNIGSRPKHSHAGSRSSAQCPARSSATGRAPAAPLPLPVDWPCRIGRCHGLPPAPFAPVDCAPIAAHRLWRHLLAQRLPLDCRSAQARQSIHNTARMRGTPTLTQQFT